MPQPTSADNDDSRAMFGFPAIGRKKVSAAFDGGRLTSDGGVLLLGQAERQMGIAEQLAACIADPRDQSRVIHGKALDSARGPKKGLPVSLADVPPVVFSEVMRHADLFTSVASIGNDPTWLNGGTNAAHPDDWRQQANAYWQGANAADLEVSAKLRRSILERTIPRLKIADRLSLDDRYLIVQGTRNRYRIHLGAGGAFCGERHICIVPKSEVAPGRVWLPFEGDRTLSIILSKALLLAADDKITDPVILQQI